MPSHLQPSPTSSLPGVAPGFLGRVTQRRPHLWIALMRKAGWSPALSSRSALLSLSRGLGMDLPVSGKSGGPSSPRPISISGSPSHGVALQSDPASGLKVTELGSCRAFRGGLLTSTQSQMLECVHCSQLPAYARYPGPGCSPAPNTQTSNSRLGSCGLRRQKPISVFLPPLRQGGESLRVASG